MPAYSYIRFSSPKQELGDSQRRQVDGSREWCERNGATLDETFRLRDLGVSAFRGKNAQRGALALFLESIRSGRVKPGAILIVESLDRISRQSLDAGRELVREILLAGVEIVTTNPERRYTRATLDDTLALMECLFILFRGHEESLIKSHRIGSVWKQRRKAAREGAQATAPYVPWWVVRSGAGKGKEVIQERVEVIQRIFELRANGYGWMRICKTLNSDPNTPKPPRSKVWTVRAVSHYAAARQVLGEYQPTTTVNGEKVADGPPIAGYYPAIVSEALFHKAQEKAGKPRQGRDASHDDINIFRSLLWNKDDGHPVYVITHNTRGRGNRKTYRYRHLMSRAYNSASPGADSTRIPYDQFEGSFLLFFKELRPSDFAREKGTIQAEIEKTAGQLADVEFRLKELQARYHRTKLTEFLDMVEELAPERTAWLGRLETLRSQASSAEADAVSEVQSLADLLVEATDEEARDLRIQIHNRLAQLVKRIEILPRSMGRDAAVCGRVRFCCLVTVHFHDGSIREFAFDHTGKLLLGNHKHPPDPTWSGFLEQHGADEIAGLPGLTYNDLNTAFLAYLDFHSDD